jgi:hypothetical protein
VSLRRPRDPGVGTLIAAWAEGRHLRVRGEHGQWVDLTPDNIHGQTSDKEWVTLRDAIARYDKRRTE